MGPFPESKDQKFLEWKDIVKNVLAESSRQFARITGGGGRGHTWWQKEYTTNWQFALTSIDLAVSKKGFDSCVVPPPGTLPHSSWAEALSTATYLWNRSPTKVVCGMTPHEAWTGEKPRVDRLRVFTCQAFVHIPKDERKKLDLKSRKYILLWYGMQRLSIVWSGEGVPQQRCHFQQAEVWLQGALSGSEGATANCVPWKLRWTVDPSLPAVQRSERERRLTDFYGFQSDRLLW